MEIAASGLFDRDWYLRQNPEVRAAGFDPIDHYLRLGGRTGRNPTPLFDRAWYLAQYPDVGESGIDPLLHYARYGGFEGRDPNPLFDSDWYLAQDPDVAAAQINPLAHYILYGAATGRAPNPLFKCQWYVDQYPEAQAAGTTPLAHYLANALTRNVDPNPWFDGAWYLLKNPEVAAAGTNPLAHYIWEGAAQGRAPSPVFKGKWYLENIPDLSRQDVSPVGDARPQAAAAFKRAAGDQIAVDVVAVVSDIALEPIERSTPASPRSLQIGRITIIPLSRGHIAPTLVLSEAIAEAKAERRHLLIMLGDVDITAEHICNLVDAFAADPLIGYVVPRFVSAASGRVVPLLPVNEPGALTDYDPGILDDIPASHLAPEFLSGCVLIRNDLVCNFPDIAGHFDTAAGALRALMAWGRRVGFRALIANRVAIPTLDISLCCPQLSADEQKKVVKFFPDSALADVRFRQLACHYREALVARLRSSTASERYEILFDCSGMSAVYNGTNECELGILDGVARTASEWRVTVHANEDAISFHGMRERYGNFTILSGELTGTYTVAVRLSQPWTMQSITQLHRRALRVVVLMLDTIAWDIIYAASPEVEPVWAFIAQHADALLHISEFTKDRFNFRFPSAPHVRQMVTRLSCHYDEYVSTTEQRPTDDGHILLIGNDLEHKGLMATLELLPRAFPEQQFAVIGQGNLREPNVTTIRSGRISVHEMERFFATARMLIFPSFYEGFGFPVVKGLGYGLDVIARRSDLLVEIGRNCAPRGRLVPFDDDASLVAVIRNIIAGGDVETVQLGTAIAAGTEPVRWSDVAGSIFGLAEALVGEPSIAVHDNREAALRFAIADDRS